MLRHCLPASIRQTLDHLPESLDDTYLHVLRRIPQANQAHAHRMLQCLMVAVRPLRVEELAEVLAFDFGAAQGSVPKYRAAWRLDDQTQAVLSTCSSLVTIVNDSSDSDSDLDRYRYRYLRHRRQRQRKRPQVVQFSHFSVKEFLMSNRLGDFSRYHIHPLSAHTILTQACLGVLLHLDDNGDQESIQRIPLATYAAEHWVEHAQFQGVASCVKNGLETLFDHDEPHFAAWLRIYNMEDPRKQYTSTAIPNPLYYAVRCGLYDLVKHLAIKHPQHVNAVSGQYTFPLLAALNDNHIEVAELLLEHGANIDVQEWAGKTILLKAISETQHNTGDIVKFLLKHGSDVNAQDNTLSSPLHLTAFHGKPEVAQILVEHKADINSQNDTGKTPLHMLSESLTHDEGNVIKHSLTLLKFGAEMNKRDGNGETPLHLATRWDQLKLAGLLLEHGADATVENDEGETPLHVLSKHWRYPEDKLVYPSLPEELAETSGSYVAREARRRLHGRSERNRLMFSLVIYLRKHSGDRAPSTSQHLPVYQ